jgi:hypothetical protein
MSLIRWYITKIKNIDPDMVHPSIWGKSRREFGELSASEQERLKDEWKKFISPGPEEKKELRESAEKSGTFLVIDGKEIPPDLRVDEIPAFLSLSKKERDKQLAEWVEGQARKKILDQKSDIFPEIKPLQLSLFNSKISTLVRALKKVSNAR